MSVNKNEAKVNMRIYKKLQVYHNKIDNLSKTFF